MSSLSTFILQHAPPGAATKPFWIDDAGTVWFVATGALDVFAQRRDSSFSSVGARHHLFRANAGAVALGVDFRDIDDSWGFIAVPLPDTRVCKLNALEFGRIAGAATIATELIAKLGDWVTAAMRGPLKPLPPKVYRSIHREEPVEAVAGECLSPLERIVWLDVSSGQAEWMGRDDSVIRTDNGPIVLTRDVWVKIKSDLRGELQDPLNLLADGRIWRALSLHHRFVLRYALEVNDEAARLDALRLQNKTARAAELTGEALSSLLAIDGPGRPIARPQNGDGLLAACGAIGNHLNVAFRMPPAAEREAYARDPVATLANASGLRFRQVALKDDWWTSDSGALLATRGEDKHWVTLLPLRNGRYTLHDAASGRTEAVTPAVGRELSPFAYAFYRPLPGHAITLRELIGFGASGLRKEILIIAILALLMGLLGLALPIASGSLVDALIPSANRAGIWELGAALFVVTIAVLQFDLARAVTLLRVKGKMDGNLQAAVWDRLLKLPVSFFRNYSAGDLAARITSVNTIHHALSGLAVSAMLGGVFSIFNLALLFYFSSTLALVAVALVTLAILVVVAAGFFKLRYERTAATAGGALSSMVYQYLRGIAKLRASVAESRAFANWAAQFARYHTASARAQKLGHLEQTFFGGYSVLASAVIFATVGGLFISHESLHMTTGQFVAFIAAFGAFFSALIALATTMLGLLDLVPIYERARPILEALPESGDSKLHPGELQGSIEVMKLSFAYPNGPEIIKDLSFSIRPGGFIALVGASGSGKSTLLRLLMGFEKPTSGSIYFDTQDLADLDLDALRRQLGVVLQSGQLIAGDIFTNIVGTSGLTLDDAWNAARMAGLEDDINQMPMGMHTVITEGASTLSGGQRQRILIARAIAQRPRIIFFDEATSALDNHTQAIVTASLARLKATRLVIAHRLSTVINADRILVLQDGRIVQNGNYDKLISEDGPFAELVKRQML